MPQGGPSLLCLQVGFYPEDAPENFEGRRFLQQLSALTGGTYQEYDPTVARIYHEGVGFVSHDLKTESEATRVEREWAEEQLRGCVRLACGSLQP